MMLLQPRFQLSTLVMSSLKVFLCALLFTPSLEVSCMNEGIVSSSSSTFFSSSKVKSSISAGTSTWDRQIRLARETTADASSSAAPPPLGPVFPGAVGARFTSAISNSSAPDSSRQQSVSSRTSRTLAVSTPAPHTSTLPSIISVRSIVTSHSPSPTYIASASTASSSTASAPGANFTRNK